jgi:DNA polymerase III delta prime subunit
MKILMHPATKKQYQRLIKVPAHGVLISGENGAGKTFLAGNLAKDLLRVDKLDNYPYFQSFEAEDSTGIDEVRQIKKFLNLKTTGTHPIRRVVILNRADNLSHEAQNALLKLLEEPPLDSVIVLTAANKAKLLPTVISRVRALQIMPVNQDQALQAADLSNLDQSKTKALYLMSGGMPGMFMNLLNDQDSSPLIKAIDEAKRIIAAPVYDRLLLVSDLAKEKQNLSDLLDGLQKILSASFSLAAGRGDAAKAKRLAKARKNVLNAQMELGSNVNAKLVLTNLFLNI